MQLRDYFSFRPNGYKFMPAFKNKMWDGFVRLYSISDGKLPYGLHHRLTEFAKNNRYSIADPDGVTTQIDISPEFIGKLISQMDIRCKGEKITPYGYQYFAVWAAITDTRSTLLAATSAGKSLIIYLLIRIIQEHLLPKGKKILLVVPTRDLVKQMADDFADYSSHDESWNAEENVHSITGGVAKISTKPVYVSTFQSIAKQPELYFNDFYALFQDECHLASGKSLQDIAKNCVNAKFRIGLTGTLKDCKSSELTIIGAFGRVRDVVNARTLIDSGRAAKAHIKVIQLKYPPEECRAVMSMLIPPEEAGAHGKKKRRRMKYIEEIKFINLHERRNNFITDMVVNMKRNSLVLFTTREHGELLYNAILRKTPETRKVFLIHGDVKKSVREEVRQIVEGEPDAIIVASFGVFSTGISIKNLHFLFLAGTTKSKIRTLQTLGRGLRISSEKSEVTMFDFCDDLTWGETANYGMEHFIERAKFYSHEQHDYSIHDHRI